MFEWIAPWIKPVASGAISLVDKIRGKPPAADLAPSADGVVLQIKNARSETIIIQRVDTVPRLLTFTTGKEIKDIVVAMVGSENAIAALSAGEVTEFDMIVIDPFQTASPDQKIEVTIHWRAAIRSRFFSAGKVSKTTTVRDIEDLRNESERRRARPLFTSV